MRRDDARRTLIAYDVPDDKRRTKIAKELGAYGDRVQYSVFIVDIIPSRLMTLRAALKEIIDASSDSVLFCDLGRVVDLDGKRFGYLGVERTVTDNDTLVL